MNGRGEYLYGYIYSSGYVYVKDAYDGLIWTTYNSAKVSSTTCLHIEDYVDVDEADYFYVIDLERELPAKPPFFSGYL